FLTHVLDDARADPSAQAYHGYFDIAAWHGYGPAKDLYTNIGRIGDLLSREGFGNVPLWVTEDGFPSANPNGEPRQAAYVFETAAYALAAGASRFLVYRQSDDPVPKNWGIMTSAGQPRMAYVAFQMAARYLAHAGAIAYAPLPGLERFTFYEPNRRVTVLWTTGLADQAATLFADARGASVVNWTGASASPAVAGGTIRLTAPGAAFNTGIDPQGSVVGGPTLVVTQDNTPHGPLPSNLYLAPPVSLSQAMPGDQRHLVVFNPGNAGVWAQVSSLDNPNERAMVQVGPRSLQRVDLDLLAGADYGGMYLVSSSAPLVAEAASTETAVPAVGAAADWYAPSAAWNRLAGRSPLTLLDASGKPVSAKIEAFGSKGVIRARAVLQLTPATPQSWSLPEELQGMQLSLTVHAAGPVAVSGANAVTRASTAWYAVRPQAPLSLFNPATRTVAQVRVQYVGGGARRALRLRL
ncbi:MAG: hypothetical protein JOZ41_02745, partial [Chloroflexi bacterium]|nr:hypothetical protein [Chloroflexota bacterium]